MVAAVLVKDCESNGGGHGGLMYGYLPLCRSPRCPPRLQIKIKGAGWRGGSALPISKDLRAACVGITSGTKAWGEGHTLSVPVGFS